MYDQTQSLRFILSILLARYLQWATLGHNIGGRGGKEDLAAVVVGAAVDELNQMRVQQDLLAIPHA